MMSSMTVYPVITTAVACLHLLWEADHSRPGDTREEAYAMMSGGFPQITEGPVSMRGLSLCRGWSIETDRSEKSKVEIVRVEAERPSLDRVF